MESIPLSVVKGTGGETHPAGAEITSRPNAGGWDSSFTAFRLPPAPGRGAGIVVAGGWENFSTHIDAVDVYAHGQGWNPTGLTLPDLPAGVADPVGAVFVDHLGVERVIVVGGTVDSSPTETCHIAELGGTSWRSEPAPPISLGGAFDAGGGKVIVGAVVPDTGAWVFDSSDDSWTPLSIPLGGGNYVPLNSASLRDGRILTVGRLAIPWSSYDYTMIYDPSDATWTEGPPIDPGPELQTAMLVPVGNGIAMIWASWLGTRAAVFDEEALAWDQQIDADHPNWSGGAGHDGDGVRHGFEVSDTKSAIWVHGQPSFGFEIEYFFPPPPGPRRVLTDVDIPDWSSADVGARLTLGAEGLTWE